MAKTAVEKYQDDLSKLASKGKFDADENKSTVEKLMQQEKRKREKPKPYGVYLNKAMRADLEKIAQDESGGNFHAVLQYGLKYFIREYKAGRVKIKKATQTKLEI